MSRHTVGFCFCGESGPGDYISSNRKPIAKYHQRTGTVSFVCGVVLGGH